MAHDAPCYVLCYADGRVSQVVANSDTEAEAVALERFDHNAVAAEQWDADGTNDEGDPVERLLIWRSEAESVDDDGAKAIAQLTVVR